MKILEILPQYQLSNNFVELDTFEEAILITKNFDKSKSILIVKDTLYQANKLYLELLNYLDDEELAFFAFDESLVIETLAASDDLKIKNAECLYRIDQKKPLVIVTHTLGLIRPIIKHDIYQKNKLKLRTNDELEIELLKQHLINLGYHKVSKVSSLNEFAIRGDIIDVYGINSYLPIRIEFYDDMIESMRTFDINDQKSRTIINETTIYNASYYDFLSKDLIFNNIKSIESDEEILDYLLMMKETNLYLFYSRYYGLNNDSDSLIDYLDNFYLVTSSLEQIKNKALNISNESTSYLKNMFKEKKAIYDFKIFFPIEDVIIKSYDIKTYRSNKDQDSLNLYELSKFDNLNIFIDEVINKIKDNYQIVICLNKSHERTIIVDLLNDHDLLFSDDYLSDSKILLFDEELSRGFINNDLKIIVYTDKELFNKVLKRKTRRVKYENAIEINSIDDLKIGDYIVHDVHGIGKYLGLIQLKADKIYKDYLHIIYKNNEKVYIPIEKFNLIRKYNGKDGYVPKINNLGGSEWTKIKRRVKQKIEDMMDELLSLYASRVSEAGFQFSKDSDLQLTFENDFEYELTKDQKRAVSEVKDDMESKLVMDRLICGDVGFGKTEVAIRAMFKAILDDKQVAFLCPTTILARQHYLTLINRFSEYGIRIVLVTRNTTASMMKLIIEDLINKKIDIVVGTHRLLSNQIKFNDLGLLIIDEEQRFGVRHKEKVKQIKHNVDVLTLSATPIPRTLQMSLTGIRKMSLLQTPPVNRIPIQTYVVEKNQYLIKEVIERELARDGQVFYLYNQTKNIDMVACNLEKMFHDVKIGVIHGKLSKGEIETTMERFDSNIYQILVCTTIIETGIDIPNANTIIIEDANKFGLAQLYQIKGRVGRSDRIGYAYLLYQKDRIINEDALKRLQAIKELTQLGSGYKIALRDLNIRGAGDLLGKNQAGNIDAIGYDMFIEMLEEEVALRKGIKNDKQVIENIEISNTGYIPENYIIDENNKIEIYQKIYTTQDEASLGIVKQELIDTYGKLPTSMEDIISKHLLEILMSPLKNVKLIDRSNDIEIQIKTNNMDKVFLKKIMDCVEEASILFKLVIKNNYVSILRKKNKNYLADLNDLMRKLGKI
ncbi:MAG: transcription-repair coupling factor [Bacilli bacterium]|jgi:transcription-repair coupling factor (superfamily II helicase)|nr:transcription-repair coupling factor [Bacilli bacterium]